MMQIFVSLSSAPNLAQQNFDYTFLCYVDKTAREWPADLGAYGERYMKLLKEKLRLEAVTGPFLFEGYYDGDKFYTELP